VSTKTYTPEEAAQILVEATRLRVNQIAKSLKDLRERELKKAIIPPHKHNTGTTSSGGIEDVPPGKSNPPGQHDALKAEQSPSGSNCSNPMHGKTPCEPDSGDGHAYRAPAKGPTTSHSGGSQTTAPKSGHLSVVKGELCKGCGKAHEMDKACGMEKALREHVAEAGDECHSCGNKLKAGDKIYQHDVGARGLYCSKPCGASHSETPSAKFADKVIGKAMLKDSKGKEKDNGIHPSSVLPEDKKPEEANTTDGSGGEIVKGKKLGKSLADLRKAATPPMAKPPSGKNMGTHVPTSNPAGGMAKEVKEMVVHNSNPVKPPKGADYSAKKDGDKAVYTGKEELNKAGLAPALSPAPSKKAGIFGRLQGIDGGKSPARFAGPVPKLGASSTTPTVPALQAVPKPAAPATNPARPANVTTNPGAVPATGPNAVGKLVGAPPIVAKPTTALAPRPAPKLGAFGLDQAGSPGAATTAKAPGLPKPSQTAPTLTGKPKV
jgi:hypothetical protein